MSDQPLTPAQKPKPKPDSKKTKDELKEDLAVARGEVERLRKYVAEFDHAKRLLDEKEGLLQSKEKELESREALLEWTYEQQEAILYEAAENGVSLANAVLEQKCILERCLH